MKTARTLALALLAALGLLLVSTGAVEGQLGGHGFSRAVSPAFSNPPQGLLAARRTPSAEEALPSPKAAEKVPVVSKAGQPFRVDILASKNPGALAPEAHPVNVIVPASDDEVLVVAAWAPDGRRLAYGTERRREQRRSPLSVYEGPQYTYPGEVWVADFAGKPKRVLKSDILRDREGHFFSFSVERIAWSPDGAKLLVEIIDERKTAATFFLTDEGKRVKLGGEGPNVIRGYGAEWLSDNETAGMLEEAAQPRLLHRVKLVRVAGGRSLPLYEGRVFAAVAWLPQARKMVGVERDLEFVRTPTLVLGDLDKGTIQELGEVRQYVGGLRVTPDETKVSYFVGNEKLAVRGLAPDAAVETYPIPLGRYAWVRTNAVVYLEPQKPGGRVGWLTLFDLATKQKSRPLGDELVQDFWVAPDGRQVAVLTTGLSPQIKIYRLQE